MGLCCGPVEVEAMVKMGGRFTFLLWHLENCHETDQICSAQCGHSWDRMKGLTNSYKPEIRPMVYTKTLVVSQICRGVDTQKASALSLSASSMPSALFQMCPESWTMSNFLALVQFTNTY